MQLLSYVLYVLLYRVTNMCSVYLYKQGREVDFPINVIQLVTPQKQDKVNTTVVVAK